MPYSNTYSDLYDPAFPQSTLDVRTELLLGGVWTDVSKKTYQRAEYQITRGHPDESSSAQPSQAALQVNNRGGQFSPRNPLGAYNGLLGKNTPCRLSTPTASYLRLENDATSFVSCPSASGIRLTGSLDIRVDVALTNYGQCSFASVYGSSTQKSWEFGVNSTGFLFLRYSTNGTTESTAVATASLLLVRGCLRVTLDATTGNVAFYTAPVGDIDTGPWTQVGATVAGSGAVTLFASTTAPLVVGYNAAVASAHSSDLGPQGSVFDFELRSGIGGSVVARSQMSPVNPGSSFWTDAAGNTWSLGGTAEVSGRRYRHHGEVPAWPQRWDVTGQDVYVPIAPSGVLRRLTQGTAPQQSSMYRATMTLTGSPAPVAYWPCEDGSNAASLASALPAGPPMTFAGTPTLSSNSSFVCSQSIPVLNGSAWTGQVPTNAAWSANVARFLLQIPVAGDTNNAVVARMYTTGTVARMDMVYSTASNGTLTVNCYSGAGVLLGSNTITFFINAQGALITGCNGQIMRVDLDLQISGSTVTAQIMALTVGTAAAPNATVTIGSASLGVVSEVQINPGGALTQSAAGHVIVQSAWQSIFDAGLFQALSAHVGEAAGARFARLCSEQGIAGRIVGFPGDTVLMGYQPAADFVSLLQQCEDADRGLMFEPRQVLGLAYRTRASMLNQPAQVALSYTAAQLSQPMDPTDDDQFTVNDVTVTRSSGSITGSSARQYLASGAQSVQAPPNGVGEYATSLNLNLANDLQAAQEAGWILHVGTVDEPRYPTLTVDLARSANASISGAAQDADIGDRVTVTGTPQFLPPDGISQVIRGTSESLNAFELTETWVCAPESPYRSGIYDDALYGHYDTDGSTLAANISAVAASFPVATTGAHSPLWTTAAGDFPFDIEVSIGGTAGERMTVTNITGSSSPQTFFVTRSVNGVTRSWTTGADIRLFQPAIYSL